VAKNPWQLPRGYDAATRKALAQIFAALRNARTHITPAAYEALRLGNIQAFINLVDWESIGQNLGELEPILQDFAAKTGVQLYKDGDITADLLFDIVDARAVIWAQNHTADLVVEIAEEMRQQIRDVMAESTQGLLTYEQAARKIRTNLSLTSRDSAAVDSYYVRQINKLVQSGMTIDKATEKASARADRYAAKLLRKRSQTIARTELANAASNGRRLGWESGVSEGYIDPASTKEWVAEPDACDICGPMDGVSVPMNDEFPSGAMMPPQHPNCRCAAILLPPEYSDEYWTAYAKDDRVDTTVTIVKHMAGKHDQRSHGGGGTKGPSSTQSKAPSTKYAAADYADVMDLLPDYDELDDALISYSGENYRKMNDYLRNGAPLSDKLKGQVELIQDELSRTSLPKPMEFTRGQSQLNGFDVARDANGTLVLEKFEWQTGQDNPTMSIESLVGQKWESKGFLSTSAQSYQGQDVSGAGFKAHPIQMRILAPQGTKGAGISSQEFEYLLPSGTEFQIVGAAEVNGQVELTMEVTNQN